MIGESSSVSSSKLRNTEESYKMEGFYGKEGGTRMSLAKKIKKFIGGREALEVTMASHWLSRGIFLLAGLVAGQGKNLPPSHQGSKVDTSYWRCKVCLFLSGVMDDRC